MTYSIVARDPYSGQIGVAVQTCNLAVGTWVPWAEAGVGAVATQAEAERSYGTLGLELMRGQMGAQRALTALLAADDQRDFRQIAFVDARGEAAVYTGQRCLPEAGHVLGESFTTQANMMANNTVWESMAETYRSHDGDFADRLLAALDAAELAGGDIRGRQTAALLVVGPENFAFPSIDLRVDHHPEPLSELRRLLGLHRAYMAEYAIRDAAQAGDKKTVSQLLQQIDQGAQDEAYLQYLRAMHLAGYLGRWEEAISILQNLIEQTPNWAEFLQRDAAVDHFNYSDLAPRLLSLLEGEQVTDG
ncbi:MAG: DUF1028 domain-containing protein [Chloroflexota bacterium]